MAFVSASCRVIGPTACTPTWFGWSTNSTPSMAGSAVQSGRANTKRWVLEFEPTSPPEIEPLMGWVASTDTQKQIRLVFPTRESAVVFAERHGWDYTVYEPRERAMRPKSYAEQFTFSTRRLRRRHGARARLPEGFSRAWAAPMCALTPSGR